MGQTESEKISAKQAETQLLRDIASDFRHNCREAFDQTRTIEGDLYWIDARFRTMAHPLSVSELLEEYK